MNKKHILGLLVVVLLSGCYQHTFIGFDVTANGLRNGVFVVKTMGGQTVFGGNIEGGKCVLKNLQLDEPGFYQLDVVKDAEKTPHLPFEVYLEPTMYTITVVADSLDKYPKILTDCKKQQEINNYNNLNETLGRSTEEKTARLNRELEGKKIDPSSEKYHNLLLDIAASEDKEKNIQYEVLAQFVKDYPQSELAAHFMARQNYTDNPQRSLDLFNKLTPDAKNSDDGKEIFKALTAALKLQPGQKAPDIAGKTFDGKPFSAVTAGKKLFLIDFWRSVNQFSRQNHDDVTAIYHDLKGQGFQVISISLDSKQLWWATAVKDDKLPWPQMSDLKGDDSPNAANWDITTIPTYYLVTGDWKIYKKDISLGQVRLEVAQYLEKHR